jgi:spermidine dehydrogenase
MGESTKSMDHEDRILGMDSAITRRDFVNASLIGAGAALLCARAPVALAQSGVPKHPNVNVGQEWYGYGGVGDYAPSHGNSPGLINAAHRIRDGQFDRPAPAGADTGEVFDVVIVSAGMAGLAAAYTLRGELAAGKMTCLVLDNHPIFGGKSKENEFEVDGERLIAVQGANCFTLPYARPPVGEFDVSDARWYYELGMPRELHYQEWSPALKPMGFSRDNYTYHSWLEDDVNIGYMIRDERGRFRCIRNPFTNNFEGMPYPDEVKRQLISWRRSTFRPKPYEGEQLRRWLDSMTYKDYVEKEMGMDPRVTAFGDPLLATAVGLGGDVISAYCAFRTGMMGVSAYYGEIGKIRRDSFPGGNSGFARYFMKRLMPESIAGGDGFGDIIAGRIDLGVLDRPRQPLRMRLDKTVVRVEHEGDPDTAKYVLVTYLDNGNHQLYRVRARAVLMGTAGHVNRRVVRDMPVEIRAAYETFSHSPALIVNVALRDWRFMYDMDISCARWFEGVGFSCNIRQPMIAGEYNPPLHPDKPTTLHFHLPFLYPGLDARQQGIAGRYEMLGTDYADYERRFRRHLADMFGSAGFDPKRDIAGVILNRWGHAFVNPEPGFFYPPHGGKAARDVIREGYGRIRFGHAELAGNQHWGPAADEGERAVRQFARFL